MAYSITRNIGGFDNNGTFVRLYYNWKADRDAGKRYLQPKWTTSATTLQQALISA
jgi:hypothetical protein